VYTLTGVTKSYQKGRRTVTALKVPELVINDGDWLAVQGRTGHGKTTLLQVLGGLDQPNTGSIILDGHDLTAMRQSQLTKIRGESIGFIFQTFNLIPTLSAAENVEAALVPRHIASAERHHLVSEALDSVGLGDRARHRPTELSGGQQQRVAIARALVKHPQVLLADEPTGNLDEHTRDEIIALLEQLWHQKQLTLVMVTHDSRVARRAQHLGAMKKGHLTVWPNTHQSLTASSRRPSRLITRPA
jgi:putative ABC transport system ATP-binding protein